MNENEFREKLRKLGLPEKDVEELVNKALEAKCVSVER